MVTEVDSKDLAGRPEQGPADNSRRGCNPEYDPLLEGKPVEYISNTMVHKPYLPPYVSRHILIMTYHSPLSPLRRI